MGLFKLAFYAAAGFGTYEILRRTGALQKAGQWLNEQVPDEYKDQARQYADQIRERANEYAGQVRERVGDYAERGHQIADRATEAVRSAVGYGQPATAGGSGGSSQSSGLSASGGVTGNGHSGGSQNISGAGRGARAETDEPSGTHVPHTVGRGVVR